MRQSTGIVLLAFWILVLREGTSAEPPPRILSVGLTAGGLFQMRMTTNGLPFRVQASTNLQQWIAWPANSEYVSEFIDPETKALSHRFFRLAELSNGLALSRTNANPGDRLVITGGPFDPSARTLVHFLDAAGLAIRVRAMTVTTGAVAVAVPFLVSTNPPLVHGGTVKVEVEQQTSSVTNVVASTQALQVADLPAVTLPPGTVTREYLVQVSNLLATASSRWQTLETASQGKVDPTALRADLRLMQSNVVAALGLIQGIITGQTPRVFLGRIRDREVILDLESVAWLDRMIVASLNYQSRGSWLAKSSVSSADDAEVLSRLAETFGPGDSTQSTFDLLDQLNSIGGMGVGVFAVTAVALGLATAPAAAAVAGTAGAVLFFSTYVAPAVMGASALALAAPFLEVQTGQPVAMEDFRPALNHLQKGSQAYLVDECQGNLLNGVFQAHGASEDLIARSSLFISSSQSLLANLNLTDPDSLGSRALANSEIILAGLHPTHDLVKYSAKLAKTFTSTIPDAAWDEQMTATVTLFLRGQGTPAEPYAGTFAFDGTILETLLYCHSTDVPCDPGGTYLLKLDNGLVTGANGVVTADGTGTITTDEGAAPFPFQFVAGVLQGNNLTGTLVLGDLESWVVTLTRP